MILIAAVINIRIQLKIFDMIKTLVVPLNQAIFSFLFFITLNTDKITLIISQVNSIKPCQKVI
jgi:hypothetical protein